MAFKATGWHVGTWQILNVTNFLPTFDQSRIFHEFDDGQSERGKWRQPIRMSESDQKSEMNQVAK